MAMGGAASPGCGGEAADPRGEKVPVPATPEADGGDRQDQMTSRRISTFSERAAWLKEHPELHGKSRREIVDAMKRAGLIAISTYALDVRIYKEHGEDKP